ncbi:MAG: lipoyl synthase, partial [Ramlibacter sp.]
MTDPQASAPDTPAAPSAPVAYDATAKQKSQAKTSRIPIKVV